TLSSPLSAVTTFVAPELADAVPRLYAFQLFVTDAATGQLRSPPVAGEISVVSTGPTAVRTASVTLTPGLNLMGVPVDVSGSGPPLDVAGLARLTGSPFVVHGVDGDAPS